MEKKTCIAMIPCPGLSHLIPLVEFAKQIIHKNHNLFITFLIPTLGSPSPSMLTILNNLPSNIDFTILPHVNIQDLPQNVHFSTKMILAVKLSLPFLHESVKTLSLSSHINLVALVFDLFSSDALDVANQFNLLSYVFFASGAISLSFCLSICNFDESVFTDLTKTVIIPGCVVPFQVKDFPDPALYERTSETFTLFVTICQRLSLVHGFIVNSFTDLEGDAIRAIEEKKVNGISSNNVTTPYVYAVGPIIQTESSISNENHFECSEWLNNQASKSVLYVSFGSGGTLSQEQLNELAFGLELSGHKFLWVLRVPNNSPSSPYFSGQKKDDPLNYLPLGFLERTKDQGLVVPSWAPQIEILAHESIASFLSHCGWSSTLESVVHGVPMIAWPLFAEQRMNAVFLTKVLKVAIRAKVDEESGIIKRDEISQVIKRIMETKEGFEMSERIKELSNHACVSLRENGSSYNALSSLEQKWQNI
ncbi:PREDICTED: hydroquinone glucosyltransferase-like [Lupinus angustifolius]|nr:PREDICTED: hydroquinone glucosyltransferase-like [Lupinus angustifolius]